MKKYRSLQFNAFLNAVKTALSIAFPLITYPYAFRVLHAVNMGRVTYATSIESYFALLAALGFSTYAVREGAKRRDDRLQFESFASEIFSLWVCFTFISLIVEAVCLFSIPKFFDYRSLILLLSLDMVFSVFSMDWINTVYEDYLFITLRTIAANIVSMILLFVFVKTAEDYYIYAGLTVLTRAIICVSNLFYCRRYAHLKFTLKFDIKKHLKPVMTLFANNVALSIYVNSDSTMLGLMAGDYYVGIYSLTVKIYTVVKNILSAVYSVTIPRISHHLALGETGEVKKIYSEICSQVMLLLIPAGTGLICIAHEVVMFMGGEEYLEGVLTLRILAVSLIGAILGGLLTFCLFIPLGREKINVQATSLSAVINIGLNLFMIPAFKQNGAAITTLISEFFVFGYALAKAKDIKEYVDGKSLLKNLMQAAVGSASIVAITVAWHLLAGRNNLSMIGIILTSVIVYAAELVLFKNSYILSLLEKIKRKIRKQ